MEFGELVTYHEGSHQTDQPRAAVGIVIARDMETPVVAYMWDIAGQTTKSRMGYKPFAWNSALLDQYLESAVQSGGMDRSIFVSPNNLDISSEWVDYMMSQYQNITTTDVEDDKHLDEPTRFFSESRELELGADT